MTDYDIVTVVRRYDIPEAQFGFHYGKLTDEERQGFREVKPPRLLNEMQTKILIRDLLLDDFHQYDGPLLELSGILLRFVKRSCPIEFHHGLNEGDPAVHERIRVFTKGMVSDD